MGKMADAATAETARNLLADVSVPVLVRIQSLYCVAGTAMSVCAARHLPVCAQASRAGVARRRRAQASRGRRAGVAQASLAERDLCLPAAAEAGEGVRWGYPVSGTGPVQLYWLQASQHADP